MVVQERLVLQEVVEVQVHLGRLELQAQVEVQDRLGLQV